MQRKQSVENNDDNNKSYYLNKNSIILMETLKLIVHNTILCDLLSGNRWVG